MKLSIFLLACLCGNALSAAVQTEAKAKNDKPLEKTDSQKKDDVEPFAKEVDLRKERAKSSAQAAPAKPVAKQFYEGEPLPQSKSLSHLLVHYLRFCKDFLKLTTTKTFLVDLCKNVNNRKCVCLFSTY